MDFSITADDLAPYCTGFTKTEMDQAIKICEDYRLTPVKRQILIQRRWSAKENKNIISPLVTVDGLRTMAERTGKYEGQVGPFWCGRDGKWSDVWLDEGQPVAAKVGVHKHGFRDALYAVAKFEEYKQTGKDGKVSGMWGKMPDLMVAKCAEALALRRAFPDELSGIYTKEEMDQAETPQEKTDRQLASALSMDDGIDYPDYLKTPDQRKAFFSKAMEKLDTVACMDELELFEVDTYPEIRKYISNYHVKKMDLRLTELRTVLSEQQSAESFGKELMAG